MRTLRIDFHRRARSPAIGWLILLVGITVLVFVAQRYLAEQKQLEEQARVRQSDLRRANEEAQLRLASLPPKVPAYESDKRWLLAAAQLSLPWIDTLRALDKATKPPVYLIGLKADPKTGQLQLDAEAPDLDAALGYVGALQTQPGLAQTQLYAHETLADSTGRAFVKVSVLTKWVVVR